MTAPACIGEPISWPRLEAHAVARDAAIEAHVAACAACAACLEDIRRDVVALPPLPAAPERAPRRVRWWFAIVPALAAAAIVLLVVRPRDEAAPSDRVTIKGIGEVVVGTVRERAGIITEDAPTFARGDRWKLVVTCPPSAHARISVEIRDGRSISRPLAPAELACGNRVVIPGAFTLDGATANQLCVRVDDAGTACVRVRPE